METTHKIRIPIIHMPRTTISSPKIPLNGKLYNTNFLLPVNMNTYFTDIRVKIHAKNIEDAIATSRNLEEHLLDHTGQDNVFIKSIGLSLPDRLRMVCDEEENVE